MAEACVCLCITESWERRETLMKWADSQTLKGLLMVDETTTTILIMQNRRFHSASEQNTTDWTATETEIGLVTSGTLNIIIERSIEMNYHSILDLWTTKRLLIALIANFFRAEKLWSLHTFWATTCELGWPGSLLFTFPFRRFIKILKIAWFPFSGDWVAPAAILHGDIDPVLASKSTNYSTTSAPNAQFLLQLQNWLGN